MSVTTEQPELSIKGERPQHDKVREILVGHLQKLQPGDRITSDRELAAIFKVNHMTVRRAMQDLAEEGYVVRQQGLGTFMGKPISTDINDNAASFRPSKSASTKVQTIAFITPALSEATTLYTKGIDEALDHSRFSLAVYSAHANLEKCRRMIENVIHLRPAGVIIFSLPKEVGDLHEEILLASGIPIVSLEQEDVPVLQCDVVSYMHEDRAALAAAFIREHDYKKVAFFDPEPAITSLKTIESLQRHFAASGLGLPDNRIIFFPAPRGYSDHPDPYSDARDCMTKLLSEGFRCDCLISGHDYPAVGALQALQNAGVSVPKEMAVLSLFRCPVEGVAPLKLTTIDTNRRLQGYKAMQLLTRRIDGYQGRSETHYVPIRLHEGETT